MSTYFIDIDGVLFKRGTNTANAGALETVKYLISSGHKIILTTQRNKVNSDNKKLCIEATKIALSKFRLDKLEIIEDVPSPRYLINDEGAFAINHQCDLPLNFLHDEIMKSNAVEKKLFDSFATMIWVTTKYDNCSDADEYVQTLIIAQSLIANDGFNHQDLVARYRSKTDHIFNNTALHEFNSGGVSKHYRGQIYRLIHSKNPLYLAKTGVTDGAAMKVLPIVAYYLFDFEAMVFAIDQIIKVTHYSIEARLSAVLVGLRYRQLLLGLNNTTDDLISDLHLAIDTLKFVSKSEFFIQQVMKAKKITDQENDPEVLLDKLAREIGLDYLAWSTPISACFWSYKATNKQFRFFNPKNDRTISINNTTIDANTLKSDVLDLYERHLIKIGQHKSHLQAHGYHWKEKIDIDTFFSISFSLIAMRDGIKNIDKNSEQAVVEYGENLPWIIQSLLFKRGTIQTFQLRKIIRHITYSIRTAPKKFFMSIQLNLGIKTAIAKYFKQQ